MKRNMAGQIVTAQLNALADGTPVTTGTTTITVVKDGVGAAGVGTVSHLNAGLWKYLPTQAETDAEHLTFVFSNTLAGTQAPQMYTEISADLSSISTILTEIVSDTDELQSNQGNWLTADLSGVSTFDPAADTVALVQEVQSATLNSAQPSITFQPMTITAAGGNSNITFAGSGSGNVFTYSRSGSGDLYGSLWVSEVNGIIDNNTSIVSILEDTGTSLVSILDSIKGATFNASTDSLEAIRDRGDSAWTTGAGGSSPTVEEIRAEMDSNSIKLTSILADTNELQSNQGNWLTADLSGVSTFDPANDVVGRVALVDLTTANTDMRGTNDALLSSAYEAPNNTGISEINVKTTSILADTNELQSNQGNWLTADLSGVSTFDPANDVVGRVALVDLTTANTDMRGTNDALLSSSYTSPDNTGIGEINIKATSILADTNELQSNQVDLAPVISNQNTINSNVLTRLASEDYTPPDNTTISSLEGKVDSLLVDTGTNIPNLISALENLSAVEVKAKLVEVLSSDVTVEPTNVPSDSDPIMDKLNYLFAFAANKITQTANTQTLRNSSDTLDISSAAISTDGTTTVKGKHT